MKILNKQLLKILNKQKMHFPFFIYLSIKYILTRKKRAREPAECTAANSSNQNTKLIFLSHDTLYL